MRLDELIQELVIAWNHGANAEYGVIVGVGPDDLGIETVRTPGDGTVRIVLEEK